MRAKMFLLAGLVAAVPLSAQAPTDPDGTPFFLRKVPPPADALKAYSEQPYRPLRSGEVYAAAFLTEGREMAFGEAIGPSAAATRTLGGTAVTALRTALSVRAPAGGSYRVGDTLIVADVIEGPSGWGDVVIPTGLLVVTGHAAHQAIAEVVSIFGLIRDGQSVLPASPVANPGYVKPVPVENGPRGEMIAPVSPRELMLSGGLLFIDLGQRDGIRLGDFVELRREARSDDRRAESMSEMMATGQVVHVGQNSSTVKLTNVLVPDIRPGTAVVRVGTIP
jgi:hypothetical protein